MYGCILRSAANNLGEIPKKVGSSKSLVSKSFWVERTFWDSSLLVSLTLWDTPILFMPPLPLPPKKYTKKDLKRVRFLLMPLSRRLKISYRHFSKSFLDKRQITYLICARLKYDLYDFLGGVLGLLPFFFLYNRPKNTPLKKSYRSYLRRAQMSNLALVYFHNPKFAQKKLVSPRGSAGVATLKIW